MNFVVYNKHMAICEEVYHDVREMINEENGVAEFVYQLTSKVIKKLHKNIDNNQNISVKKIEKGVNEITAKLDFSVGEYTINAKIIINCFLDKETFTKYGKNFPLSGGSSDLELQSITAYTYAIDYNVNYRTLYKTLQHEISHIYESFMADRQNKQPMNDKYLKLYNKITSADDGNLNPNERNIMIGAYMWFQTEQTAYANELDSEFRNMGDSYDKSYLVYNSTAWTMLETTKWCVEKDSEYKLFIERRLGIKYEKYHKMVEEAYHDFARRIARICCKYSMSQQIREGWMPYLSLEYKKYKLI